MKMQDDISGGFGQRLLTGVIVAGLVTLMPLSYANAQNIPGQGGYNQIVQPGYVCEETDQQGNCVFWREVYYPPAQRQIPNNGTYSYENDYRRPPPSVQRQNNPISAGSGLMPSPVYAPGFGTSHAAPRAIGR